MINEISVINIYISFHFIFLFFGFLHSLAIQSHNTLIINIYTNTMHHTHTPFEQNYLDFCVAIR